MAGTNKGLAVPPSPRTDKASQTDLMADQDEVVLDFRLQQNNNKCPLPQVPKRVSNGNGYYGPPVTNGGNLERQILYGKETNIMI